jgi:O-antigen ligase
MPEPESLRIIPACLFGVFFLLGILRRPVYFPMSFMTLWLTKLSNYYPFVSQLKLEFLVGILGLVFVFLKTGSKAIPRLSIKKNLVHKYFLMLLGCMFVSYLFSWNQSYSWDIKLYGFVFVIILYLMITMAVETERDLSIFIWFFVLLYAYLAYEPAFGLLTGTGGEEHLYGEIYTSDSGLLAGHVALANNMNQMLPFGYYLFMASRNKFQRILAGFIVLIFLFCLIGSKSRGGVAGFLMLGVLIVYFSDKRLRNSIFVAVIGAAMFIFSSDMGDTLSRIDSGSAEGRLTGLTHGLGMILQGNILGVGPGCFLIARSYYFGYYMESHNIYGQVMGDLGIPGTIVAILFVRQIFSYLNRSKAKLKKDGRKNEAIYVFASAVIVSLASRLFVSMASHGLYFFFYYVVAALSVSIARISGINMQAKSPKK